MIIFFLLVLFGVHSFSQHSHLNYYWVNRLLFQQQYNQGYLFPVVMFDSSTVSYINNINNIWVKKKQFDNPVITIIKDDFNLFINPALNLIHKTGIENLLSRNTRGLICSGQLSKNFFFYTDFIESQEFFYEHQIKYIKLNNVIPGEGRPKPFKNNGFDYFNSSSYIGVKFTNNLNICAGYFKTFAGYGYRSLLFGDNVFQSPTFRIFYFNKYIQYTSSFSVFQNATIEDNMYIPYSKRFYKLNILNFSALDYFNFSIFDASIYLPYSNKKLYPRSEYYLPLMGYAILKNEHNDSVNSLIGAMFQLNYKSLIFLYSQFIYDGKYNNKEQFAYQLGTKFCKAYKDLKIILLFETNFATEFLFRSTNSRSNFIHYNEYIGHPFGNNFREKLVKMFFQYRRLYADFLLSFSHSISLHDNINETLREKQYINIACIETGFYIHRSSFTSTFVGFYLRNFETEKKFHYFYGGIKTNIFNNYW